MSYWVKSSANMTVLDRSLEARPEAQDGYLTRNDAFFVCNSGTTPRIDPEDYRLKICGDGIKQALSLSYRDLLAMPQRTVPAVLECAGNHRALFRDVMGQELDRRPQVTELMWRLGAVGMAAWRGVPLRHVLGRAGLRDGAYHVCLKGGEADSREGEIAMPLPLAKAMSHDTLLALEMNGVPLPPDHGFPVRVLVPGWIGAYSVKWLREIEVSTRPIWVPRNTEFYVLMGEDWPAERYAPARGAPITERGLKSALALPWPAALAPGDRLLHGYAHGPDSPIARVCWSADRGATWQDATITGPNRTYGWARFHFTWRAVSGRHALMTRATDVSGRVQPLTIPFNTGGYLYNAVHPHPVEVA